MTPKQLIMPKLRDVMTERERAEKLVYVISQMLDEKPTKENIRRTTDWLEGRFDMGANIDDKLLFRIEDKLMGKWEPIKVRSNPKMRDSFGPYNIYGKQAERISSEYRIPMRLDERGRKYIRVIYKGVWSDGYDYDYSISDYFDQRTGQYLGPDRFGVEPVWKDYPQWQEELEAEETNPIRPRKGESSRDFTARCMSEEKASFPKTKQRIAVCLSKSRKRNPVYDTGSDE